MRSLLLFSLLLSVVGISHAQEGTDIQMEIKNFQGKEAYLAYYYGDKQYIKDTLDVISGKTSLKADTLLPGGIYLVVLPPSNSYFELIIDKDQQFSITTDTTDFVSNMVIQGSNENDLFYGDLTFLREQRAKATSLQEKIKAAGDDKAKAASFQEELSGLDKVVKDYRKRLVEDNPDFLYGKVIKSMQEPQVPEAPVDEFGVKDSLFPFRYYRAHFFDNLDFNDERMLRTPVFFSKIDRYLEQLTYKHPDSINTSIDYIIGKADRDKDVFQFLVVNLLNKYANSKIMGMDGVYVHMVEQYYMSGKAFWTDEEQVKKMEERALALTPTLIGRLAPNFRVQDQKEEFIALHDVDAKYTVLYFWDYDCGHCKKITPQLMELYADKLDHDKVALFSVSINGSVDIWKEKIDEYKIVGIATQDHYRKSGFDQMYDIRSTPRIFLLDEKKNIVAKQISVEQLE
ncbi:MAG: thioredoxin-like domain-containing protein, partial [Bacteroidota bacterium]